MDRGAWQAVVHRVAKSQTQLKQPSMHAHTTLPCITEMKGKGRIKVGPNKNGRYLIGFDEQKLHLK